MFILNLSEKRKKFPRIAFYTRAVIFRNNERKKFSSLKVKSF